jgi:hypothetical protein
MGKWLGGEHVISEPVRAEHLNEMMDRNDSVGKDATAPRILAQGEE